MTAFFAVLVVPFASFLLLSLFNTATFDSLALYGLLLQVSVYSTFSYIVFRSRLLSKRISLWRIRFPVYSRALTKTVVVFSTAVTCNIITMRFYTGSNILIRSDAYSSYQQYFADKISATSLLSRSPYILLNTVSFICTLFLLYVTFNVSFRFTFNIFSFRTNIYTLILPLILSIYGSLARGTYIEIFNLIIFAYAFFILSLCKDSNTHYSGNLPHPNVDLRLSFRISPKRLRVYILLLSSIFLVFYFFFVNVSSRVDSLETLACYTREICLDTHSFVYLLSKPIGFLIFILSGYFLFSSQQLGHEFFWSFNLQSFFDFILGTSGNATYIPVCERIDCGVNWQPSLSQLIGGFGIIITIAFYIIGALTFIFVIRKYLSNPDFFNVSLLSLLYYIFITSFFTQPTFHSYIIISLVVISLLAFLRKPKSLGSCSV